MSNLYRGPSIDASYQASVHLSEGFQRRRLKCEKLTDNRRRMTDAKWWQKLNNHNKTNKHLLRKLKPIIPQNLKTICEYKNTIKPICTSSENKNILYHKISNNQWIQKPQQNQRKPQKVETSYTTKCQVKKRLQQLWTIKECFQLFVEKETEN